LFFTSESLKHFRSTFQNAQKKIGIPTLQASSWQLWMCFSYGYMVVASSTTAVCKKPAHKLCNTCKKSCD
jgi:hypothetical protein